MNSNFENLGLRPELLSNLSELGFNEMTPIQAESIPKILKGQDVIGQAKTGSGKTASFGLGILNSIDETSFDTQALVLCPTRELAEQVAIELRKLARMIKNTKILTITGGVGYYHQESSLSHGAHIIVGTPGRVAKLIKTDFIRTDAIKTFVLDEADRMLDMGFFDEILGIERTLSKNRQSLLFSATFPDLILDLSGNVQKDAQKVFVDSQHQEGEIEQHFYQQASHKNKKQAVISILNEYRPDRLIIFCKTKVITDKLTSDLLDYGVEAAAIHGDIEQNERTLTLTRFSNRSLSILVATDVAARGLDIKDLSAVINFDLPQDPEDYIHRIGRTGRAGKKGLAFSLFVKAECPKIDLIEKAMGKECIIKEMDNLSEPGSFEVTPPMETVYISGGKKQKLRPGDILGAMVKEALLNPTDVGDITILPIVSFVAVKREKVDQVIEKLSAGKIKNRNFRVGIAR